MKTILVPTQNIPGMRSALETAVLLVRLRAELLKRERAASWIRGALGASASIILTLQIVVRWQRFHKL